jgi:hypothetical protein
MAAARQDPAESARLISQARRLGLPYGIRVRYIPELSPGPS